LVYLLVRDFLKFIYVYVIIIFNKNCTFQPREQYNINSDLYMGRLFVRR